MIRTELGKFLKKLRVDHNEKLSDMSNKLDISNSYLSMIETGRRVAPNSILSKIIDEYKLSYDEQLNLRSSLNKEAI